MRSSIIISSFVLFVGVFLGKISGFTRELFVAWTFGTNSEADLTIILLMLPDLIVHILAGGSISAVLIPEFKSMNEVDSFNLYMQSFIVALILSCLLSSGLAIHSKYLLKLAAPGFGPELLLRGSELLKIVIWMIPLTVLSVVNVAYLNSKHSFFVASLGVSIFNVTLIAGFILLDSQDKLFLSDLAKFVILGAFLRFVSQLVLIIRKIKSFEIHLNLLLNVTILYRYLNSVGLYGFIILIPVTLRAISSLGDPGTLASFNYTIKLIELPLSLYISTLSVVMLPVMSELFNSADKQLHIKANNQIKIYLLLICIISLIVSSLIYLLKYNIINLVLSSSLIPQSELIRIGEALGVGIYSLPLQGVSAVLTTVYISKKNSKTPLLINLFGVIINAVSGYFLYSYFGIKGLMISLSITFLFITVVQFLTIYHYYKLKLWDLLFNINFFKNIVFSVIILWIFKILNQTFEIGSVESICYGVVSGIIILTINLFINSDIRNYMNEFKI